MNRLLLEVIARQNAEIYDFLFPRGPAVRALPIDLVALNPQPLPPGRLGAALASEFIRIAWLAARFGLDAKTQADFLDEWCPIPPKKLRLPPWVRPFPKPFPKNPPDPPPDWWMIFHLGFATGLAAASVENKSVGKILDSAIDRSLRAIEDALKKTKKVRG